VSTGQSPFMLNYGHHPYLPTTVLEQYRVPGATDFVQRMQRLIAEARREHRIATERQAKYVLGYGQAYSCVVGTEDALSRVLSSCLCIAEQQTRCV
jgi:hypothetical protein